MGLTCVTAAKAGVEWKSNSRVVGGDPAIPPPSTSILKGFLQDAGPWQAWHPPECVWQPCGLPML